MYRNGINMGQVKKQNRASILKYMNSHPNISRKEIAEATGLTPAAVTQICNDFLDMGLIMECGVDTSESQGAGRKKVKISINYQYGYIIGVNIESEETVAVIADMAGNVIDSQRCNTNNKVPASAFVDEIADSVKTMTQRNKKISKKILGGCVAVAGEVDRDRGMSVQAYGIWKEEVPLCEMLEERLGYTFIIENNVDAFAIAELVYGTGTKYENLFVLKWGPGVGCSIIIDNGIYEGRHGRSAELGHFIVDKDGDLCSCGRRGCLETKISVKAMKSKKNFDVDKFGDVYKDFLPEIDLFARSLVNSMSILAPNRVVFAGKLFADEAVRQALIDACKTYDKKYDEQRILYSPLADREDYIGPIATYLDTVLFQTL